MARASRGEFLALDSKKLKEAQVRLANLRAGIVAGPDVVVSASGRYFQKMQSAASAILRDTRWYIREGKETRTETGNERVASGQGRYRGRYESGAMHNAFVATKGNGITTFNKKRVRFAVEFGWLRGMPEYTLFQEFGTARGIKAMNALMRVRQEIEQQMIEEMTRDKAALARDIKGYWLGSIQGTRRINPQALKNDVWRQVLGGRIDQED